jgi:16S rRNA (cytosine1402-N4)-methyltransferase
MPEKVSAPRVLHKPVLSNEVLEYLAIPVGGTYVDLNLGQGGHAALVAARFLPKTIVGIDADPEAIRVSSERLKGAAPKTCFFQAWSDEIGAILDRENVGPIDGALYDLGLRSDQLEGSGRGFSFRGDEPLDMRMGPAADSTAADLVNRLPEADLAETIFVLGEDRNSRRIAAAIVRRREVEPFATAADLADVIRGAVPAAARHGKTHPATKTFQALRIAVNGELSRLRSSLPQVWDRLAVGGRLLAITFHSLEDGAVKRFLAGKAKGGEAKLLAKKPIPPTAAEVSENPRARSAKLRVAEKLA